MSQTTTISVEKTQEFSESNDYANSTAIKIEEQSHESRTNDGSSNDPDDLNKYLGPNRKSFQLRALARKTISYQKRQMFINVCCITLCPLLMVAISGIMGIVITNLLNNSGSTKEYLFCSNATNASDPTTGQFYKLSSSDLIPTVPADSVPNAPGDVSQVGLTNFYLPPAGNQLFSLPGNEDYCVYWFGHDYPFREPYEPKPTIPDALRKDTTLRPDPPSGWLNEGANQRNQTELLSLLQYQTFGYAFVADYNGDSGQKPRLPAFRDLNSSAATSSNSSGLLGTIDTNIFVNVSQNSSGEYTIENLQPVPFFNKLNLDPRGMDDQLTQSIRSVVKMLSGVDKSALEQPNPSVETQLNFFIDVANIVANMPWGNILFDLVDASGKNWNYTLQIGDDIRISNAASYPKQGIRRVAQQSQLSNGFLQTASNNQSVKITTGYRIMPQLYSSKISVSVGSLVGGILYPFGVSFLLAIFVITLVKEKEERILVMMRMNGLKSFAYYLTHYIHFYSLHVFTTVVFIIAGLIFKLEFFTLTEPGVYIILFFVWGHVQIALAFLFSVFFNKERSALVITFLIVLCGVIIGLASDQLFKGPAPVAYYIWPPFAFYRALSLVNVASISKLRGPYKMSDLTGSDEVLATIIAMVIGYIVYLSLAFYLAQIIPTEYGIPKKWHFIFSEPWRKYRNRKNKKDEAPATLEAGVPDVDPEETKFEDEDVKAERQRVLDGNYSEDSPLVMKRMRKVYGSGKLAVKDVTFSVEKSLIFGLLGPNGAGKTTLISILTGLYPPTSGSASINNYDVNTNIDKVYMSVGVCPQHDILWDDLTVEEHLLFYARLKGFPAHAESEAVKMALQKVRLEPFKNRLSKGLSGGEKRRLSIAIALVGNPGVVFLDEPTTGLDPEVRRLIWNIIQESKIGRTIILTTHSMEEAEVLCNLIGIMAKGTLRCLGPQLRLKEVYGTGFKLSFSCKAKNVDRATEYIERLLPNGSKLDSFVTNVSYEFVPEKGQISKLFTEIEEHGKHHGIDDWGLSQTSLEEVFLRIIGEADAEAD